MAPKIETCDGMVLVDAATPNECSITLEVHEALDLARGLIAAAVDAQAPASDMPATALH